MSWNANQKNFLRMAVVKRSDGRLDVSYLKDATTAATATVGTLDEAVTWLESTHGVPRRPGAQTDLFEEYHNTLDDLL
jgi:hypothetical protein